MDTEHDLDADRRRFLALTTTGAAGLAGCSELRSERTPEAQDSAPEPTPQGADPTRTVSIIVQPDPGALREAQLEVKTALDEGEIGREEARSRLAEREQELLAEAVEAASSAIDSADAEHLDTVEPNGTLLVEGDPLALIDLLEEPLLSAVAHRDRFEQARQRATAGSGDAVGNGTDTDGSAGETNSAK
ncbi:probable secreted glycoprotein [Natronomonas moolapensis 8.8.11]|uniref:Probable secreted glycoprotein n=1 Tax=Natronomonas moolapensis (strain DSM 18674 / CECT 7526 / JCM 14361 / 8.8.11) TaxID=268739 RepID=M1XQN2_NATM8|nr:hypothetical protein [Natronomonas moolapensis]CCQ36457.1 probable secreted glycoprotein [Natronomonas moolapensis 8.8.11]